MATTLRASVRRELRTLAPFFAELARASEGM